MPSAMKNVLHEGNLDLRVGGKYRLQRRLGGGGFGTVYQAIDVETQEEVAVKLEHIPTVDPSFLDNEVATYRALAGGPGIPSVLWEGDECEYNVMVVDLLGPSLDDLFNYCGRKFSLKTVLMLADQLICRVEYIHSKKILHQDIKPENILMGVGRCGNVAYMTDFGMTTDYYDTQPGHCSPRAAAAPKLRGTARFASIRGHLGKKQSRRDDLESLGYMMVYFLRGTLPWQGLKAVDGNKDELILEMKRTVDLRDLCEGLPQELLGYFEHVRALGVNDKPGYSHLRKQFALVFKREGFDYDNVFDWTVLKYLESISNQC